MATYETQGRDFRLQTSKSLTDYNKIGVGKSTLNGNVVLLKDRTSKRGAGRALDKEKIEKMILNEDVKQLRQISEYFYRTSGIYKRLCKYMAYLYRYDWFIVPRRLSEKVSDDKVIEGWVKSCAYLENCNLKRVFGEIALEVIKYGCYYGYLLKDNDAAYLQKLPANYCRSRYSLNGQYAVEFNIKYFDEAFSDAQYRIKVLKMYPREFQKAYVAYKKGDLEKDFSSDESG